MLSLKFQVECGTDTSSNAVIPQKKKVQQCSIYSVTRISLLHIQYTHCSSEVTAYLCFHTALVVGHKGQENMLLTPYFLKAFSLLHKSNLCPTPMKEGKHVEERLSSFGGKKTNLIHNTLFLKSYFNKQNVLPPLLRLDTS